MGEKTACLISCSDHYAHRLNVMDECLLAHGYETTYITSDFDHTKKLAFTSSVPGVVQIHTRPYRKNLSIARILSHREFARDVFKYLESLSKQPEVLVVLIPPNFLAYYAAKYKERHPDVKLIFDVFDLWPETFPFEKIKKLLGPAFSIWAWLRDHNLGVADFVITECELFRGMLDLPDNKSETVYLCAEQFKTASLPVTLRHDAIDLCYLGAINNIIDIPAICELIGQLIKVKPVTLHIIGKGEREQDFVEAAKVVGADVRFYGPIYDETKKWEIMCKCHFGLNIMKPSVCVGLTMKSVDYFRFSLPIISSIAGDTKRLVQECGIGVQLEDGCAELVVGFTCEDCMTMRDYVDKLFMERFEKNAIIRQYCNIMSQFL